MALHFPVIQGCLSQTCSAPSLLGNVLPQRAYPGNFPVGLSVADAPVLFSLFRKYQVVNGAYSKPSRPNTRCKRAPPSCGRVCEQIQTHLCFPRYILPLAVEPPSHTQNYQLAKAHQKISKHFANIKTPREVGDYPWHFTGGHREAFCIVTHGALMCTPFRVRNRTQASWLPLPCSDFQEAGFNPLG